MDWKQINFAFVKGGIEKGRGQNLLLKMGHGQKSRD